MPSHLVRKIKKVRVGPFTYKVVFEDTKETRKGPYIRVRDQKIAIPLYSPPDVQLEDLIHEIFHAIWDHLGLEQKGEKEESVIWPFSVAWLDTLQRNPKLLKAIER